MTDGVMLARPVPGLVGETQRMCHVFPLPATPTAPKRITALCGASFSPEQLVRLGNPTAMPCERCLSRVPQEPGDLPSSSERLDAIERTLHQLQTQVNGIKTALAIAIGTHD